MSDSSSKNLLSPQSRQLTRRAAMPLGLLALLSLAACASQGASTPATASTPTTTNLVPHADNSLPAPEAPPTTTESVTLGDTTPAPETPQPPTESVPPADSVVTDSLIYITPEGAFAETDLAQFDKSSFVLEGSDGATSINLGELDAVSIVTNSEGNQVFAVERSAVNKNISSSTSSAPSSYNLKVTSEISFTDQQGKSQKFDAGDVITEDALIIDSDLISVVKELADVQGNTAQLAAITVDLGEIFTSVSAISFSAVDDKGNAIALTDKNGDGIAAEFSLDELAASFGESGTITVHAEIAEGNFMRQSFSVVVMQEERATIPNREVSIANALAAQTHQGNDGTIEVNLAEVFAGDGDLTLTTDVGTITNNILTVDTTALADGDHTIRVTAKDGDGDTAIDTFVLTVDKSPTIAAAIADDTQTTNSSNTTLDLATVFADGSGTFSYAVTASNGGAGISIANSALTIDYAALGIGTHTVTVTATDSDAENADLITDEFVLEVLNYSSMFNNSWLRSNVTLLGTTLDDAIMDNSFQWSGYVIRKIDFDGDAGNDTISSNEITARHDLYSITFDGGAGDDTISNNRLRASKNLYYVTFDGGDGNDTISYNNLNAGRDLYSVTFAGGDGNDTISNNKLSDDYHAKLIKFRGGAGDDTISDNTLAGGRMKDITFDGGAGDDTISGNTLAADNFFRYIKFEGGDGDDTISGNTLTSKEKDVKSIKFEGGAGNDTISDNHFEALGEQNSIDTYDLQYINFGNDIFVTPDSDDPIDHLPTVPQKDDGVFDVILRGGAGNDVFRNNTASQANGELAWLTIHGGDGEDTVEFRLVAGEYAGLSDWIDSSDGGGTTITITGDGAAVTLIDVETISFADGASYSAADAWVMGNEGVLYDLANIFPTTYTAYSTDGRTIGNDNTLTLAGTELTHGANTFVITVTASDNTETTETITINSVKDLGISDVKQHDRHIFDLGDVFVETTTTTYTALTLPDGVTLDNGNLIFANTVLSVGDHPLIVTATDGDNVVIHTLFYSLDAIKDQSEDESNITYRGTTLADAITGNSFAETSGDLFNVDLDGRAGDDTISNNTLKGTSAYSITFDGGAGDDTITGNNLSARDAIYSITFAGGEGNDTISGNNLEAEGNLWWHADFSSITFDGGAGDDTISSNTLTADAVEISIVTFAGGDGNDTISNNTLTANRDDLYSITIDGGAGNDTISGNTISAWENVFSVVFDGGTGDDTISDNHFESKWFYGDVYAVTLMGGAGDDMFRDNTAIHAKGGVASLTMDGGEGEDTVVFRLGADKYQGITNWIASSDGGATTVTLSGDGAAVTLIDVETISFTDGASYSAADAWAKGNGGILYDLANVFQDGDTTAYTTDSGTIGRNNTLTLAGTELAHGANTVMLTATASDGTETTETITVNAVKTLKTLGVKQHDLHQIDLNSIFVDAYTYTYAASTTPSGISLNNSTLSFDNTVLSEGIHFITITAADGDDAFTYTLTYDLDIIKDQNSVGSNPSYIGTTFADEITGNSLSVINGELKNVYLLGGDGDDTISDNTLTAGENVSIIRFHGGDGDDTISGNTLTAIEDLSSITFHGGDGDDTISDNTLTAGENVSIIRFHGGDGDDTISGNTLTAIEDLSSITFHGGDGDDTISDNHFEALGEQNSIDTYDSHAFLIPDFKNIIVVTPDIDDPFGHLPTVPQKDDGVFDVILMGGAGDDVFLDNTATQANGERASITIDGGSGTDKVYFDLAQGLFTIKFDGGGYGSNITVTDNNPYNLTDHGVDSYAEYVLIDVEELYFNNAAYDPTA